MEQLPDGWEPRSDAGRSVVNAAKAVVLFGESTSYAIRVVRQLASSVGGIAIGDWKADKWIGRISAAAAGTWLGVSHVLHVGPLRWLAVVASVLPLLQQLFKYLGHESGRRDRLRKAETPSIPDLQDRLEQHKTIRREVGEQIDGNLDPPLEQRSLVGEVLQEMRVIIKSGATSPDMSFVLVCAIPKNRYKVVATRGPVEDAFREGVIWSSNEVLEGGDAFLHLTEPFPYWRVVIHFELGSIEYFLVGLAGALIPDHAILRTSVAATELVLRSVVCDAQYWRRLLLS